MRNITLKSDVKIIFNKTEQIYIAINQIVNTEIDIYFHEIVSVR